MQRRFFLIEYAPDRMDHFRGGFGDRVRPFPDNLFQADRAAAVIDADEQEGERVGQRVHLDVLGVEVQAGRDGDEESGVIE
jgi:hypothetical protein